MKRLQGEPIRNASVRRWLESCGQSLTGKRAAVVGATGSLGAEIAADLSQLGAETILIARNPSRAEAVAARLRSEAARRGETAQVTVEPCDLSRLADVSALCARLCAGGAPLDVLVQAAGVFRETGHVTPDGLELHFQTNFLAPVRMTRALLPLLRKADAPCVVMVTSLAAYSAHINPADPQGLRLKNATRLYARSKRLLTLAALGLARETDGNDGQKAVRVWMAHPGISATHLFSPAQATAPDAPGTAYAGWFLRLALPLMRRLFMTPEKAALSVVYAAVGRLPAHTLAQPRGLFHAWGFPCAGRESRLRVTEAELCLCQRIELEASAVVNPVQHS